MSGTDDRADKTLPITAEVGGEGGSYADPTIQADTFKGAEGNTRIDQKAVHGVDGRVASVAAEGEQVGDDGGAVRHATDRPDER